MLCADLELDSVDFSETVGIVVLESESSQEQLDPTGLDCTLGTTHRRHSAHVRTYQILRNRGDRQ